MTDADRTDKAEERENMYIMMFTLQSLQNYGLSVKKTVERSLDFPSARSVASKQEGRNPALKI